VSRWLTDLSTAVQASGLTVHEVAGWQTRHAPDSRGSALIAMDGVVGHHTAGPKSGDHPSLGTVVNGRPGLQGLLAQLFLSRSGEVYVCGAGVAWHAGEGSGFGFPANDANWYTIGIEAESAGVGDWTPEQLDAYPRLVRALADHYDFPIDGKFIGHLEWAPLRKIDPHGWPGGMNGLRSQAKSVTTGDDMTQPYRNSWTGPQTLSTDWSGPLRLGTQSDKKTPIESACAGPGYASGHVEVYGDFGRIRVRGVVYAQDSKGVWQAVGSCGSTDLDGTPGAEACFVVPVSRQLATGQRIRIEGRSLDGTPATIASLLTDIGVSPVKG
jgi:hypothetical protein